MAYIVNDHLLFALIKSFGVIMIIGLYRTINEKYKDNAQIQKISNIGQRLIILMYIFIIFNNLFVIQASALSFPNLTINSTGAINTANGYFDDPGTAFGYSGTRNVYAVSELTEVNILEPISWVSGTSPTAYTAITNTTGSITDAVVHNGYLYFIDSGVLKKKKTRAFESPQSCNSTDTTAGGCVSTIATLTGDSIRVYNGVLYFTKGIVLHHLDSNDNDIADYNIALLPPGQTQFRSFAVTDNGSGGIQTYAVAYDGANVDLAVAKAAGRVFINTPLSGGNPIYSTSYITSTYVYVLAVSGGTSVESLYYISNGTAVSVDYATSDTLVQARRAYVGGLSLIGLIAQSATSYETYNSIEVGTDSLPVVPSEITYQTATIESLETTYYNKSDIFLQYNVVINSLNVNNLLLDFSNYRWMVSMTDPNGVSQDIVQSPECQFSSVLDTTCEVSSTLGMHAPSNGWIQGTWTAKLYEINIVNPNRVLIATSQSFTVLNTTVENQSVIPPAEEPITSGSAPSAISSIDQMVAWLGLGVNSVSKLLFAMIWVAAFGMIGLYKSNGNVAMAASFVPYGFFTFIEYIPKWMFVIYIILLAIVSKAFR